MKLALPRVGSRVEPQDYWRWNLPILSFTTFLTVVSFSLVFPFLPLFVQELGVKDPGQAAFWSGIAGGSMGAALAISGPFWGIMGDRYGRKKNLLRAFFLGAIPMGLMGLSGNVYQLVLLRFVGGLFSGSFSTAMALAASQSPSHRVAYSIGFIQTGSFLGSTLGPFLGGVLADAVGLRYVFFLSGGGLMVGGVLAALLIKEDFHRPQELESMKMRDYGKAMVAMVSSRELLPLLLIIFLIQLVPSVMFPVLPLFLGELAGQGSSVTSLAGIAFAFMGIASSVAAVGVARLSRQFTLKGLLVACALVGGVLYMPMWLVNSVPQAMGVATSYTLFTAGMNSVSGALMGTAVPREKHGRAFGVLQSFQSMAWGLGPLLGGSLARSLGLREVFPINGLALILLGILAWRFVSLSGTQGKPSGEQPKAAGGLRAQGQDLR